MKKCRLTPLPDGPLKLESGDAILYRGDEVVPTREQAFLCVCGQSAGKPFCDGAHVGAGFTSERQIGQESIQEYAGQEMTIFFNRSICSGAGNCVRGLPGVFRSGDSSNWIFPDEGTREEIQSQVEACPSGALSCREGGEAPSAGCSSRQRVTIVKDGPYNVESVDLEGATAPTHGTPVRYALCRCGLSANKPYCDYTHGEKGWKED